MSGTLQASVVKDSASATNNLAMDASGNVTVGNNLTVAGTTTHTGAVGATTFSGAVTCQSTLAVTGTITGSSTVAGATGILYPLVSGTAQASTSGTSITFSSIPSWVKRITINFNGVSTSGTSIVQVQIGSGSVTTTGYNSVASYGTAGGQNTTATTGIILDASAIATAAALRYGSIVLSLLSSNTWVSQGNIYNTANVIATSTAGASPALSGALDRVVITTVNGTDTFDAGSINILYE